MSQFNKWVRRVHRWLVIPFLAAIIILIVGSIQHGESYVSPGWLGALGIGSILSLALTGIVMFLQHYLSRLRRGLRNKQTATTLETE